MMNFLTVLATFLMVLGGLADELEDEIVLPDPDDGSGFTRYEIPVKLDTDDPDQDSEDVVDSGYPETLDHIHYYNKEAKEQPDPTFESDNMLSELIENAEADMMKHGADSETDEEDNETIAPHLSHDKKMIVDDEVATLPTDNEIEKLVELKHEALQVELQEHSIAPVKLDDDENGTEYVYNENEITDDDEDIGNDGADGEAGEEDEDKDDEDLEVDAEDPGTGKDKEDTKATPEVEDQEVDEEDVPLDEVDWEETPDANVQSEEALLKRTHSKTHNNNDEHAVHQQRNHVQENGYQQNENEADQYIKTNRNLQDKTGLTVNQLLVITISTCMALLFCLCACHFHRKYNLRVKGSYSRLSFEQSDHDDDDGYTSSDEDTFSLLSESPSLTSSWSELQLSNKSTAWSELQLSKKSTALLSVIPKEISIFSLPKSKSNISNSELTLPLRVITSNMTGLTPSQDPPSPPHSSVFSNYSYSDDDQSFTEVELNISPGTSIASLTPRPTSHQSYITDDPERQPLSLSFLNLAIKSHPPTPKCSSDPERQPLSLSFIDLDIEKPQSPPLDLKLEMATSTTSIQPAEGLENKSTAFNIKMTSQTTQVFFKPHKKHTIATNFSPHIHTQSTNTETQLVSKQDDIRKKRCPTRMSIVPGEECDMDSLTTDLQGKVNSVGMRASQESLARKGKITKAKSFSRMRKTVSGLFKSDKKRKEKLKALKETETAEDAQGIDHEKFKRARSAVRKSMQMKRGDSPIASGSGQSDHKTP